MDIVWQQIIRLCDRPLEVILICRGVYVSVSEGDIAVSVARRVMTELFPDARRARMGWSRRRDRPRHVYFDIHDRAHYYHPSVLVAYVCGYLCHAVHVAVVRQLVTMGAKHADVALQFAAKLGSTRICDYLITHAGAMVNRGHGIALRVASRFGHVDVVDFLLSRGADPRVRNSEAVSAASSARHCEVVSRLLASGAEATDTSITRACATGWPDVIRLLLRHGAPVNNISALDWAIRSRDTLPLRLLLEHGLDPDVAERRLTGASRYEHLQVTKEFKAGRRPSDEPESSLTAAVAALHLMYNSVVN
jgi:hypothetical protein